MASISIVAPAAVTLSPSLASGLASLMVEGIISGTSLKVTLLVAFSLEVSRSALSGDCSTAPLSLRSWEKTALLLDEIALVLLCRRGPAGAFAGGVAIEGECCCRCCSVKDSEGAGDFMFVGETFSSRTSPPPFAFTETSLATAKSRMIGWPESGACAR